jgi:hemerythrin
LKILVSWKDSYSVRIPQIDDQHKALIDLMNRLYAATQTGETLAAVAKALDELEDYTEVHFACEERLMTEHRYSGLAAHRSQHATFIRQLEGMQGKLDGGDPMIGIETLEFLRNWLADHILNSDRAYTRELVG